VTDNSSLSTGYVRVIDTATNTVLTTVVVGIDPQDLAITADGTHVYVACFSANSVFVIDTSTNTVTATIAVGANPVGVAITPVPLNPTATALTSSRNHSFYGQPVTFTATVTTSGPIAPTGTVNFRSGSHGIGTGTLNASGVATFTTSILKPGLYRITALYNGDASNLHSMSAVLYQAVKRK